MNADASVHAHIYTRGSVIDVATAQPDQRHRERSHLFFCCVPVTRALCAGPAIDEEPVGAVDEEIGDVGVVQVSDEGFPHRMPRRGRDRTPSTLAGLSDERLRHVPTLEVPPVREQCRSRIRGGLVALVACGGAEAPQRKKGGIPWGEWDAATSDTTLRG